MLRTLWFAIKVGLLVAAALWVVNRPGTAEIQWLGYDVRIHVGLALLILLFAVVVILFFFRLVWDIGALLAAFRRWRRDRKKEAGFRALTLGLTAVAAGDVKQASAQAQRARRDMPEDGGLSVLLEAQAARLSGDDAAAQRHFLRLLENKDTAFLGLRGLLVNALEKHDYAQALELSRKARAMYPRQPWVLRMAYDLELRQRDWAEAQRTLKMAVRHGAVDREKADIDSIAIMLQQVDEDLQEGRDKVALAVLKRAFRARPSFVPSALRLAQMYIDRGKKRAAAKIIQKTWRSAPHPELAALWAQAIPDKAARDNAVRLKWFEDLVALKPDSAEGQMAAAEEALEQGLWGAARQYMERAHELRPSARLYRLRARLAQAQGRSEEASLMLRRAADAPAEKVWTCAETGRIYERWSPVAQPHGSFNTIVWDYPHQQMQDRAIADRTELLITAPAAKRS